MEIAKRITILMILVLLTVGPSQSAEEPVKNISDTRTANCLVKITCDPAILPPDLRAIDYLLRSSGVGGKAAREVLSFSTDDTAGLFTVEYLDLPLSKGGATLGRSPRPTYRSEDYEGDVREDEMYMEEYMMGYGMGMEEYSSLSESSSTSRPRPSSTGTRSRYGTARTRKTAPTPARTPSTTRPSSVEGQTYLLGLNVNLPEDVKPAAREFMIALVDNLRHALLHAYEAHEAELQGQLSDAEKRRDRTQIQLAETTSQIEAVKVAPFIGPDATDIAVRDQLETIVDLSNLSQQMSFEEVVIELENSVDPPLQIQPNWKDLLDYADIEPTTPAGMDPLTPVKLRKALELLLAGFSSDLAKLGYVVDEGVIVIATEEMLPEKMVTCVYEIAALAHSPASATGFVRAIQESVEPDSWYDLSDTGEGTISVFMGNKLAIYQTLDIHEKLQRFLQSMTTDMRASTPSQVPPEMLIGERRDLIREKRSIEMEIARLQARQMAIEMQIVQMSGDLVTRVQPSDLVVSQLEQLVEMHTEQLALMEKQYEAGRLAGNELADVKEKLTRAKIDLAKRRQQTSLSAGSARVEKYNEELADLTIELAEKTAAMKILDKQLGQTEQQLTAATMIDPRTSRIRMATRAFEIADQRVNELNTLVANLQAPVVSILGAE